MNKIITAVNNPKLHEELENENTVELVGRDILYREGILEILEKDLDINYIIIDNKIPGEIELNNLVEKILEKNKKIKIILLTKKENNIKNKNLIEIYYEKEIDLYKIKNYKNFENISEKKITKNNIKNKFVKNNNTNKIINFFRRITSWKKFNNI